MGTVCKRWSRSSDCISNRSTEKTLFYNFIMNKVFYEYQAKHHELCKPFINYIQKDSAIEIYGLKRLIDNLLLCAMLHKHPSFSAEQEVRISPPFVKDADPNVQYKALDTIKKVYVLDLNKLCKREEICFEELIDSIVIGSRSKQSISALQGYCTQLGLSEISKKIRKSDCPLR